jgi:thiamine biosynthesis protein ThiS
MRVTVNGEPREVAGGITVAELLSALGIRTDAVAVERNRALVRRRDLGSTRLSDGDALEVVTFVGGG